MEFSSLFVVVVLIALAAFLVWLWSTYNALVKLRNEVKNAFAQVDTEIQQRLDLIPALVNSVKGYVKHESQTLEAVIQARNFTNASSSETAKLESDDLLSQSISKLMVVVESYPELKANSNFLDLQTNLTALEKKINLARRIFNEHVKTYNVAQEIFPANLVAKRLGHMERQPFQATANATVPPSVDF